TVGGRVDKLEKAVGEVGVLDGNFFQPADRGLGLLQLRQELEQQQFIVADDPAAAGLRFTQQVSAEVPEPGVETFTELFRALHPVSKQVDVSELQLAGKLADRGHVQAAQIDL